MAWVSTKRMIDKGRSSVDEHGNRSYEVVYQVITDNIADGAASVLVAPGLPAIYSIYNADHEYDTGSILKNYSPSRTSDPCIWEVTCNYESWAKVFGLRYNPELQKALSDAAAGMGSQQLPGGFDSQDPTTHPTIIRGGFRPYQRTLWIDRASRPVRNSAKERFDPPIEFDENRPYLTITRYERPPFNLTRWVQYQDTCNSDVFLNQPINSAKMRISWDRTCENKVMYYVVTYDIEFRYDLWIPEQILDAGYTTLPYGTKAPGPRILGPDSNPCPMPVPLYTVTGGEFPALPGTTPGDVIQLPTGLNNGVPYATQYLFFNKYRSLPFSVFNLTANL